MHICHFLSFLMQNITSNMMYWFCTLAEVFHSDKFQTRYFNDIKFTMPHKITSKCFSGFFPVNKMHQPY